MPAEPDSGSFLTAVEMNETRDAAGREFLVPPPLEVADRAHLLIRLQQLVTTKLHGTPSLGLAASLWMSRLSWEIARRVPTGLYFKPGFPIWMPPTGPRGAETLAKPRIPSFTRRVRQDSAARLSVRV